MANMNAIYSAFSLAAAVLVGLYLSGKVAMRKRTVVGILQMLVAWTALRLGSRFGTFYDMTDGIAALTLIVACYAMFFLPMEDVLVLAAPAKKKPTVLEDTLQTGVPPQ